MTIPTAISETKKTVTIVVHSHSDGQSNGHLEKRKVNLRGDALARFFALTKWRRADSNFGTELTWNQKPNQKPNEIDAQLKGI